MSGETIVLPEQKASQEAADRVIENSRKLYATTYEKPASTDNSKKSDQSEKDSKDGNDDRNDGMDEQKASNDALENNDDS